MKSKLQNKRFFNLLNIKLNKILLSILFLIFILLRMFSNSSFHYISGDEGKYLKLAKNFPYHILDNNQLFLQHPPFFPYLVHFFSLFFEDYIAGTFISFASSIITFFIIYNLFMFLTNNYYLTIFTLIFYTLSYNNIFFAGIVYKESFMVMLFMLAIFLYLKGLKNYNKKTLLLSGFIGAIASLTTDQVIFLVFSFIAAYFMFRDNKTSRTYALLPIIIISIVYISWLSVRVYVYTNSDYYPAGVDGIVVNTKNFGLNQILSTNFFDESSAIVEMKRSDLVHYLFVFGYMFNMLPFTIPLGINREVLPSLISANFFAKIFFYTLIAAIFLYGIIITTRKITLIFSTKRTKNHYNIYILLVFLIFIYPITYWLSSPRMVLTSVIMMGYFISLGLYYLLGYENIKKFLIVVIILLIIWTPFWLYENKNFLFSQKLLTEVGNTGKYIESLQKDGVMTQVGYSPDLNYITSKRYISMPHDSSNLDFLIKFYNINYLLYGNHYWASFSEGEQKIVYNYKTIKYIREHPEKYKLLKTIREEYGTADKPDEIYVYEVIT